MPHGVEVRVAAYTVNVGNTSQLKVGSKQVTHDMFLPWHLEHLRRWRQMGEERLQYVHKVNPQG